MAKQVLAKYEVTSTIIKAMAHPTRLLLIEELSKQQRCVCELTQMVGADTSTISKHLALLKNAGIVADQKRGQMVYYRLTMHCAFNFITCLEGVIRERAKAHLTLVG
jgi:ArsR family transcriptional regulator